jgi:hypothetical protein
MGANMPIKRSAHVTATSNARSVPSPCFSTVGRWIKGREGAYSRFTQKRALGVDNHDDAAAKIPCVGIPVGLDGAVPSRCRRADERHDGRIQLVNDPVELTVEHVQLLQRAAR